MHTLSSPVTWPMFFATLYVSFAIGALLAMGIDTQASLAYPTILCVSGAYALVLARRFAKLIEHERPSTLPVVVYAMIFLGLCAFALGHLAGFYVAPESVFATVLLAYLLLVAGMVSLTARRVFYWTHVELALLALVGLELVLPLDVVRGKVTFIVLLVYLFGVLAPEDSTRRPPIPLPNWLKPRSTPPSRSDAQP